MLFAGTLFPLQILVFMCFMGLIGTPIVWLLKKAGSKIEYPEPMINVLDNLMLSHLAGTTIHLWGAFAIVYHYLKTGEVWTPKS